MLSLGPEALEGCFCWGCPHTPFKGAAHHVGLEHVHMFYPAFFFF